MTSTKTSRWIRLITLALLSTATFGCASEILGKSALGQKPNIILILADDMGYGDPRCYNPDSKVPTPNIDRLAASGVRLTDAHTPSAVCTPTRYGLLTGRYAWRTELKSGVLWPWDRPLIAPDRLTLPAMLRQRGYATACIGKWHLGWNWPTVDDSSINDELAPGKYDRKKRTAYAARIDFTRPIAGGPTTRGFNYYFGDDVPNFPPYCFIENDRIVGPPPSVPKPDDMYGNPGPMQPGWRLDRVLPTLRDKAVAYIEQQAEQNGVRPFFLYLPLTAPHTPIAPSPRFQGTTPAGDYGDFVHEVDAVVGAVTKAVDQLNLARKTLIIFTSDNGSPARAENPGPGRDGRPGSVIRRYSHRPNAPWRGMKADIYEGGHRVPFIARWKGTIPEGAQAEQTICLTDMMRTFASLTGAVLPRNAAEDSTDVLAVLLDPSVQLKDRPAVVHHSGGGMFAIRQGPWKLILGLGSGGWTKPAWPRRGKNDPPGQLYNLSNDPRETTNLYNTHPQIVSRLTTLLESYRSIGRSTTLR